MIRTTLLLAALVTVTSAVAATSSDSMTRGVAGARTLKGAQKNPASFTLEQLLVMSDGASCYTYRSTNSFGGIVPGQAVLIGDQIATDRDKAFPSLWRKHCENRSGRNVTAAAKRMI